MGRQCRARMDLEFSLEINRPAHKFVETDTTFVIILHASGVEKEEIDISINKEGTQISVIRRGAGRCFLESVISGSVRLQGKLKTGHFHKVFWIPNGVVVDRIGARFDGVEEILFIYMPKSVRGLSGITIEEVQTELEDGEEGDHHEEAVLESDPEASDNEQADVRYEDITSKGEISESDQEDAEFEPESGASNHKNPEDKYEEVDLTEEIPKQQDFEEMGIEEIIADDSCDEGASEKENMRPDEFQGIGVEEEEEERHPHDIQNRKPLEETHEEIAGDDKDKEEIPELVEIGAEHLPQVEIEELIAPDIDNEEEDAQPEITRSKEIEENQSLQVCYPEEIEEENNGDNDHREQSRASEELQDDGGNKNMEEKIPEPQPLEKPESGSVQNGEINSEDSGKLIEEENNDKEPTESGKKLGKQQIDDDQEKNPGLQSSDAPENEDFEEEITSIHKLGEEDKPEPGGSRTNESSAPTPREEPPEAIRNEGLEIPQQIASPADVDNDDSPQEKGRVALLPHPEAEPLHQTPNKKKSQGEEITFPPIIDPGVRNEERDKPQEMDFTSPSNPDKQEPSRASDETQSQEVKLPEPRRSSSGGEDAEPTDAKAPVEETTAAGVEKEEGGFGKRTPAGGGKIIPRPPFPGSAILMGTAFIVSLVVLLLHLHKREKRRQ